MPLPKRTVCHCGHDQATHHEKRFTCLGSRCDCEVYVHEDDPPPTLPELPSRPEPETEPSIKVDWTDFGGFIPGVD